MNEDFNCPRCRKGTANHSSSLGVLPCDACQQDDEEIRVEHGPEFYSLSKHERISNQRDQFAADIEQPWEPGKDGKPNKKFTDIYPELTENYFTNDQLKDL